MTRDAAVDTFLNAVEDTERRRGAESLCDLMTELTGEQATMWGTSIIGFGRAHYRYASGREGDTPLASFSPRKREFVLYLGEDVNELDEAEQARLGPHRAGKGCLYLKRLDGVDPDALRGLIERSIQVRRDADPTNQVGQA